MKAQCLILTNAQFSGERRSLKNPREFSDKLQVRVKSYRIDERNVQLEMREKPHERDRCRRDV